MSANGSAATAPSAGAPALPAAAGPCSEALIAALARGSAAGCPSPPAVSAAGCAGEPLGDDDLQLALYVLYELHYRGFAGVAEELEWNPALLALRGTLERVFITELMELVGPPLGEADAGEMDILLRAIEDSAPGPSLSRYLETRGTMPQFLEFVIHRSAYQLKEADPHSWAIPRLSGVPKAALVEIQSDEYGEGQLEAMHAEQFATTMRELGLHPAYGAYLDLLPGVTLATVNMMSLFGLHRRWRGALVGHLAAFEMSSPLPNRRYSNALLRLGASASARAFYDVHVVADAVHEQVAAVDLAGGLAAQEPALASDILFGARALTALDARFAAYLLERWERGESSLRGPAPPAAGEAGGPGGSAASADVDGLASGPLGAAKPIAL